MRFPSSNPSLASSPLTQTEHRLVALARAVAGRFQVWRSKRAVLAELSRLDQWTLSDLRIHPCDFDAIADGTYQRGGVPADEPAMPPRTLPPPRLWPL